MSLPDATAESLGCSCALKVMCSSQHTLAKALLAVLGVVAAGRQPLQVNTRREAKHLPEMIRKMALIEEASVQRRLSNRSAFREQLLGAIQPNASLICMRRKSDFFPKHSD